MTQFGGSGGSFGPNAWLVDDMYDRFLADPDSVSDSWREFFADYRLSRLPEQIIVRALEFFQRICGSLCLSSLQKRVT